MLHDCSAILGGIIWKDIGRKNLTFLKKWLNVSMLIMMFSFPIFGDALGTFIKMLVKSLGWWNGPDHFGLQMILPFLNNYINKILDITSEEEIVMGELSSSYIAVNPTLHWWNPTLCILVVICSPCLVITIETGNIVIKQSDC